MKQVFIHSKYYKFYWEKISSETSGNILEIISADLSRHPGSGMTTALLVVWRTLCGILLFHWVLQFTGNQTRWAAAAWTAPLKR